jgi:hypothetical protein
MEYYHFPNIFQHSQQASTSDGTNHDDDMIVMTSATPLPLIHHASSWL